MDKRIIQATICSILTVSWIPVSTADIYRMVDKDDNVTFTDQPPENSDAENIQQKIDEAVERNTAHSLETQRQNNPDWVKQSQAERKAKEAEIKQQKAETFVAEKKAWKEALKQAKENVKRARADQKAGKESIEGDFIGKAGGGARPSEQYFTRQLMLEEKVNDAEKALKAVRKSRPKQ